MYWALLGAFVVSVAVHVLLLGGGLSDLSRRDEYVYEQSVDISGSLGDVRLSMAIPSLGGDTRIADEMFETGELRPEIVADGEDRRLVVSGRPAREAQTVRYRARIAAVPIHYRLDPALPWPDRASDRDDDLASTAVVQAAAPEIAGRLAALFDLPDDEVTDAVDWTSGRWQEALARRGLGPVAAVDSVFAHCRDAIAAATFSGTTDALTTLRLGQASCGGKSRLMAALCRRLGLPARIVGGVILGQGERKRAHHLWVEVRLGGLWVPYDALNDYRAEIPARFLTLYHGDEPLISHSRGLTFDYGFSSQRRSVPLIWLDESAAPDGAAGRAGVVVPLLDRDSFSAILLAPFALLLVVFARQVVGLESIGIFLPILLGFSLLQADWLITALQMGLAVVLGVLARFLLARLNLLHVARTAVMITFVVLFFLVFSAGLARFDSAREVGAVVLPLAALAMAVEKFTIVAMDRGTRAALGLLLQTVLLALGCRAILVTPFFQHLIIAFPETLLLVMAMIIMTGGFRGLRWRELWRFRHVRAEGRR